MTQQPQPANPLAQPDTPDLESQGSKDQEQRQTQEEMLAAYIEQQRRMSCPGCGEDAQIF